MSYINIGIITSAIITIALVLLQDRSSGTGGAFGGSAGGFYQRRRGMEKTLFVLTILFAAMFVGLSLFNLTSFGRIDKTDAPAANLPGVTVDSINSSPVTDGESADGSIKVETEPLTDTAE